MHSCSLISVICFFFVTICAHDFPNETINRRLDSRETVRIAAYNSLVGFLNWHEPWFQKFMDENCNTKCIYSQNIADVRFFC